MAGASPSEPLPTPLPPEHGNVPRRGVRAPPTTLLGRDREVASIRAILDGDETLLVTLTGPGGVGKTRLALEVASQIQRDFAHGACFVSLAAIRDPALVPYAVADALGIREHGDQSIGEKIASVLSAQHFLLVLDNLEQVPDAALWLAGFLTACPRAKALVTSRVLLNIQGERHFQVHPLPVPHGKGRPSAQALGHSPSVALFCERARAIQPSFALNDANAEAVRDICKRLDGLPLAIELAAARIKVLSPDAILARLADRLTLLTGRTRDVPSRLQAMRSAIGWSYELLSPTEQAAFRRLSIFIGGFSLETARAIAMPQDEDTATSSAGEPQRTGEPGDTVLELVASLVDQSLVQRVSAEDEELRFGMLETIREYGLDRLAASGELDRLSRQHAVHMLAIAERSAQELTGPDQIAWLNRLEFARDDFRAAFAWLLRHSEHDLSLRLAIALWRFGYIRGYLNEARGWLDAGLRNRTEPTAMRGAALNADGVLASVQGATDTAAARHREALEICSDHDDRHGIAMAYNGLGDAAEMEGSRPLAFERFQAAMRLFRELDDQRGVAVMLTNIGNLHWEEHELERATTLHEEARTLYQAVGDRRGDAWSVTNLGALALERGDLVAATSYLGDALRLYQELGDQVGMIETLERFSGIAERREQHQRQATLLAAAAAIRDAIGVQVYRKARDEHDAAIAALRARLGESFVPTWRAGYTLTLDSAAEIAVTDGPSPSTATSAPPPSPHGLSEREMEVLEHVVGGLSNRQIADVLFISPRTVTTHISHIFDKLGLDSRTAAVAYALRHSLV